ncbi:MAG: DUF4956 domain-containing protein [Lachnospiraceae bacterium]|nr:DUF4956 domain-containing protein [Lachnospiraceae bacterium]
MNTLFQGVFDTSLTSVIGVGDFLLCIGVSLIIGVFLAAVYTYKNRYTQSFILTLALIPAVVCVVIMMVNGNVGAGVAVAGAFSLVRFRSVPGTAKEICAIFLAMAAGLITGMGYLAFGVLFAVILSAFMILYTRLGIGSKNSMQSDKTLQIVIPENLDYNGVFDEVMSKYTQKAELEMVKTTNMGSLFKLTYHVVLKDVALEKEFIDKLRCRNGNLEISLSKRETVSMEL